MTIVRWKVDGKHEGMGYFQRWSLPVPGDHVVLDYDADHLKRTQRTVEVERRVMQQPERDVPYIEIVARSI